MKVLVSAASKHGATIEIAASIAAALSEDGVEAIVMAPAEVTSVDGFGAAVIGSGVYAGRWLEPARDLLMEHRDALARIPVWLFSSGPVGDPPKPDEDPIDAPTLMTLVGARGHRVFAGMLDKHRLGLGEKVILAATHAAEGDFRPWADITEWGRGIAAELREPVAVG